MSVTVYKMSGEAFFVTIFEGFRVRNLRNEVYDILRNDLDNRYDRDSLIFFSIQNIQNIQNLQNEEIDDNDFVNDGDEFHVFVRDVEDRIQARLRLSLADNNVICLRLEDGFLIDYYGWNVEDRIDDLIDIEPQVNIPNSPLVIEVYLSDEVCEVMRQDIINERNNDLVDLDYLDLENLQDNEVFNIFFERFIRLDNFQHNIDFVYI